ncbi:ATP-dependent Clp protease ATP-binding subunit ClpC1 [Streptomyces lavendulae subsp. lavendulae]|uniref:ATP-dependent Clp protease ATP-binding subunit ClpC1 n=1 Tax=Streptomyces lavendulae subsp. lavendulae TaxID=58340 RepID=A0A2K8PCS9_STRLA|nr:Clp protease N-terminal domain-containing protein [Streptomyces lavendulae]ATZ24519.1 ATP-dependent Clp protease ATP-binding subunit ClpC1 [Streptomyces lavendulae subsp. lavendulae]QUQ54349.1 ATP-dependent Clp protease ATP-binding subunit ClpC1 [Streptomyces lavendulae subsp. lavendulae]
MFERFTRDARDTVKGALDEARRAGAATVTEEHLLLSLMGLGALDPLGVDRESVRARLAESRRRGGMSKADEEALAGLGIDLGEIVARIEETHGAGALATPPPRRRGIAALRRRDREAEHHVPFTAGAKKVLEQSLRIALGRHDRHIGTLHLLLALLSRPGTVSEVLTDHGITYAAAETALAA